MKQFNLEEYLNNPSKKVVTRDGRAVKIYCTDYIDKCGLFVIGKIEGNAYSYSFREDGRFLDHKETDNDLFFASEKHEGWFNIYHSDESGFYVRQNHPYKSQDEADEIAKANPKTFFTTVKIEWEE